jgi:transposase
MSRRAVEIKVSQKESDELNRWVKCGKTEQRKVERAKIVLRSAEGKATDQIARELQTRPSRVSKWRKRFAQLRIAGLEDEPRSGRTPINDERVERRILDQLAQRPPPGFARWNGRLAAEALGDVSDDAVWRVMRKYDLHLDRRQSWSLGTDPEFCPKASAIVGLYLKPPENALVLCVAEKPHIQALERAQGYIRLPNGRAVSGFAHEYERHGTTTLCAALETATGLVKAGHYKRRRRREFLDFMNGLIASYGHDKEIHVILDNLNKHKPGNDRWLKSHPNVLLHFTPTHTSWLNQIECWFSILGCQALQGAGFVDVKQLGGAIDNFICAYNAQAAPFEWRQEEISHRLCPIISFTFASKYYGS